MPGSETTAKIPPHNLDAERALLGSMMLSKDIQIEAIGTLTCDDFYSTRHQTIFEAMQQLTARSIEYDVLTLADKLTSMGKLETVGGYNYLVEISTSVTATAYWQRHADIVKRLSTYRHLITAGYAIVGLGNDASDDVIETVSAAEQTIMAVTEKRIPSEFELLEDNLMPVFKEFEYQVENKGQLSGITTGFSDLDRKTHGFRPGELIVLGARPAVGKSSLALNIATGAAKAGVHVAFFSLEMTVKDIVTRILCAEAEVSLTHVRDGNLADRDWTEIAQAMGRLEKYHIAIDDSSDLNITQLRAKARRELRTQPKNGLVVVDYLQLMQPTRRNTENRQVEIAEISRGLKILAKELQVPVLALSQLSRAIETRKDQRPQLSDLRESGAIEQDADVVMFLDRLTSPGTDDEEGRPRRGQANLIIAKNRNGPTGEVRLAFREMYTKFQQVATQRQEEGAP